VVICHYEWVQGWACRTTEAPQQDDRWRSGTGDKRTRRKERFAAMDGFTGQRWQRTLNTASTTDSLLSASSLYFPSSGYRFCISSSLSGLAFSESLSMRLKETTEKDQRKRKQKKKGANAKMQFSACQSKDMHPNRKKNSQKAATTELSSQNREEGTQIYTYSALRFLLDPLPLVPDGYLLFFFFSVAPASASSWSSISSSKSDIAI